MTNKSTHPANVKTLAVKMFIADHEDNLMSMYVRFLMETKQTEVSFTAFATSVFDTLLRKETLTNSICLN